MILLLRQGRVRERLELHGKINEGSTEDNSSTLFDRTCNAFDNRKHVKEQIEMSRIRRQKAEIMLTKC